MRTFKEIYNALEQPVLAESTGDILTDYMNRFSEDGKLVMSRHDLSDALHKAFKMGQDDMHNRMKGSK